MLLDLCPGWSVEVERGPDWLFVRLRGVEFGADASVSLAEEIWRMLEQEFTRRLVLEMQDVSVLPSELIAELVRLHKRISAHGGLMRLSGLSEANQKVLQQCRLADRFPQFANRPDAVMGQHSNHPR
jgi:anti-anti-sigma factor